MTAQLLRRGTKPDRRPLVPRNLTEELAAKLAAEIEIGQLVPGTRLPTEQELMAAFGVSRTVVREAVASLRSEGLVTTRQGAGAFVAADVQRRPFRIDPESLHSIDEILRVMELRMGIEVEAAGFAAERRSAENLDRISSALGEIDSALEQGDSAINADFEFHCAIARATENPFFGRFLEFLGRFIIPRQSIRAGQGSSEEQAAYLRKVQSEHRIIYDAIVGRDEEAARAAMRTHLLNSRRRYRRIAIEMETRREKERG